MELLLIKICHSFDNMTVGEGFIVYRYVVDIDCQRVKNSFCFWLEKTMAVGRNM